MSSVRKLPLILASISCLYSTGCITRNKGIQIANIDPKHTLEYYHRPSEEIDPKYDLFYNSNIDFSRPLDQLRDKLEGKLDAVLPMNPKVGKPKGIKAKHGIYWEIRWSEAVNLLFSTESQ